MLAAELVISIICVGRTLMSERQSDSSIFQSKLHQLGGKFIERTRIEMAMMATQIDAACGGDSAAAEQVLLLAHRINGTAAMLGFAGVSEPARAIEQLLRDGTLTLNKWRVVERYFSTLQLAVMEAEESLAV